jgi:GNAT superfamily N-acetyltransferase
MITYRKAVFSDAEKLAEIRSIYLKEIEGYNASEEERIIVEQANLAYFKKALTDNSFVSWIAIDNEEIVATSGLSFSLTPPLYENREGKVAYIMNMITLPDYRNRGIASELFKRIVDEAIQLGYKKITLIASDMGRKLYEKYGFRENYGAMVYFV